MPKEEKEIKKADIIPLDIYQKQRKIGRAHVRTPVTRGSRMPSSA